MPEARSYIVSAGNGPLARHAARMMARTQGHPSPDGPIIWMENLGPAAFGGWRYEVIILVVRNRRDLERAYDPPEPDAS